MRYMLDTNICIYAIKRRPEAVIRRISRMPPQDLCVSAVTSAELYHGVYKSRWPERNALALGLFFREISVLPFGAEAAIDYGKIRAALERAGTPIGPLDMLIAAHARSLGLTLVTNNVREFCRVEGLTVEDWTDREEGVG